MTTKIEAAVQAVMIRMEVAEVGVATLRTEMVPLRQLEKQVARRRATPGGPDEVAGCVGNRGWVIFMVGVSGVVTLLSASAGALLTFYLDAKR